jgi:hypothetical protein
MAYATEGLYLLQTRELIMLKTNIYKLGRSFNLCNRMSQYPKNSNINLLIECSDSIKCETELLKIFKKEFIKSKEYGNEYFEGDKNKMKNIIFNYIENNKNLREIKSDMKVNQNIKDIEIIKNITITKSNNKLKNDKDKDIEINNKLKSKYCPKCKTIFKYPSFLKNHITNSVRCKLNEIELIDFYKTIEESKTNTFNCKHCKSSFTRNSTLLFHNINSKCGKEQLYKKNKVITTEPILEVEVKIIEVKIINSFTNENIPNISFNDFKKILDTDNPEINILKLVYSNIQNNNYFKYNLNKKYISYLNEENIINTIETKIFIDMLLKNSIYFLKLIFISNIKDILLVESKQYFDKINIIENKIINKKYKYKELEIYLELYFRQNSKNIKNILINYVNNDTIEIKKKRKKDIENKIIIKDNLNNMLSKYIKKNYNNI